jgi:glycosyltransferase involved in cell wall biosynthesis
MYCGLPVLAEDFCETRKIVKDVGCGLLVDSCSPSSIAQAVLELLCNPGEAKKMGDRGRLAVLQKFNFDSQVPKLIRFYEKLIRNA